MRPQSNTANLRAQCGIPPGGTTCYNTATILHAARNSGSRRGRAARTAAGCARASDCGTAARLRATRSCALKARATRGSGARLPWGVLRVGCYNTATILLQYCASVCPTAGSQNGGQLALCGVFEDTARPLRAPTTRARGRYAVRTGAVCAAGVSPKVAFFRACMPALGCAFARAHTRVQRKPTRG